MERKEYSAGAVKLSFWFIEFRKVVELLHEGKNAEQIKSLALNENLFAAPTTLRANQIYHTVTGLSLIHICFAFRKGKRSACFRYGDIFAEIAWYIGAAFRETVL